METPIQIAVAAPDDYEWGARLMASTEPWITFKRDLAGCRDTLLRPGTELLVAWQKESRLGFILLAPYGLAGSPYVACLAVAAEARGQGVGSQLLRFAEERFADRAHIFMLVSSFNRRARNLYGRQGYEFVGELKDFIVAGHSELILHKRIS